MSVPVLVQASPRRRRGLTRMSIDLLRLSAPHEEPGAFRAVVNAITAQYSDIKIRRRLTYLTQEGFITSHGSPRVGWLTDKGRRALELVGQPS